MPENSDLSSELNRKTQSRHKSKTSLLFLLPAWAIKQRETADIPRQRRQQEALFASGKDSRERANASLLNSC